MVLDCADDVCLLENKSSRYNFNTRNKHKLYDPAHRVRKVHDDLWGSGVFTLAVYVHYFMPGSLKIHTKLYTVRLGEIRELIDNPVPDPLRFVNTRRWLPKGEAPYPGYCRAPGSGICIPALCNCQKLKESWNNVILNKLKDQKQKNKDKKGLKINEKEKKGQEQKKKEKKQPKGMKTNS